LRGVAAWAEQDDETWRSIVIATRPGFHRKGIGFSLKSEMLNRARNAGMLVVVSVVHRDNVAMLKLNGDLPGADLELDPEDAHKQYMICTITL
jgi:GNAT superfamily N-acetyltransferase